MQIYKISGSGICNQQEQHFKANNMFTINKKRTKVPQQKHKEK